MATGRREVQKKGRSTEALLQRARRPPRDEYNVGVLDRVVIPLGRRAAKVDDKLRIRMPYVFQDAMAMVMPGPLFIISLDGVTVSLYPAARWAGIKREILERDEDGDSLIAFAEQEGIAYEMDPRAGYYSRRSRHVVSGCEIRTFGCCGRMLTFWFYGGA